MIWFDRTQRSIVVGCRECGAREVCTTPGSADSWAADHVNRAHPAPSEDHRRTIRASQRRATRRDAR